MKTTRIKKERVLKPVGFKYKQIGQDYARAKWNHRKPGNNLGAWLVILIIFMIGFSAMLIESVKAAPVENCSITGVTTDNLMSPERAEYMILFEHGQEFEETDMQ